eukprot:354671-Chlamydomonas_euryale.AAC.2
MAVREDGRGGWGRGRCGHLLTLSAPPSRQYRAYGGVQLSALYCYRTPHRTPPHRPYPVPYRTPQQYVLAVPCNPGVESMDQPGDPEFQPWVEPPHGTTTFIGLINLPHT